MTTAEYQNIKQQLTTIICKINKLSTIGTTTAPTTCVLKTLGASDFSDSANAFNYIVPHPFTMLVSIETSNDGLTWQSITTYTTAAGYIIDSGNVDMSGVIVKVCGY